MTVIALVITMDSSPIFLGAFAELLNATISFVMSVHMEQLGFHWVDFHEIWHWSIFLIFQENSSFMKIWQE